MDKDNKPQATEEKTPPRVKAEIRLQVTAFIPSKDNPERGDMIQADPFVFNVEEDVRFKILEGTFSKLRKLLEEIASFAEQHEPRPEKKIITPDKRLLDVNGNPLN